MAIKSTSEAKRRRIRRISATKMEETREFIRVKCPKCEGRKRIKVYDHDEHAVSHNFYNEVKCPDCHGIGHVYKEPQST